MDITEVVADGIRTHFSPRVNDGDEFSVYPHTDDIIMIDFSVPYIDTLWRGMVIISDGMIKLRRTDSQPTRVLYTAELINPSSLDDMLNIIESEVAEFITKPSH